MYNQFLTPWQTTQFNQYPSPTPLFQQVQQQAQPQQPLFTVAQVPTAESVDQIQLQPNERKIILVQNQPVLAMRSADAMGLVNTRYFQLVDYDPHAQQSGTQAEYAPLGVVQDMQGQIQALAHQMEEMKGALNNGKSSVKRNANTDANA